MTGFSKHGNERPGSIKDGEFLNHQDDCGLDAFAQLGCFVARDGNYRRFVTKYLSDLQGSSSAGRLSVARR